MAIKKGIKVVADNRKAFHEYHILDKYEAGLVLTGTEVKSIRQGKINLKESYVQVKQGEIFLIGAHISPYEQGNRYNPDPIRMRKLLMHKHEIHHLFGKVKQDGLTLMPLKIYFKDSKVKLEIGLAKGKKIYDKRDTLMKREVKMRIDRKIKEYNR